MIEIKRLPPDAAKALGGPFYALVDGNPVGVPGRLGWKTRKEARACATIYLAYRDACPA